MADVVYTSFMTDVRGSIGQLNVSITSMYCLYVRSVCLSVCMYVLVHGYIYVLFVWQV